ncbi:tRNA-dependent cyclodipeptide synthase [Streptomyces sp. TX20-6-3]|uniref:tRNA-dependent cyclodipeptide synthase n=1 Tax=Streptomyces sp. TX20-6-3 TaxID=3028705 RepID=UPI0029AB7173|nr:tRNA-dependent cyclodipeptide synthase [Streptomyces sp. TX20-6-3]MDX2561312.1 tRNA-dependent cyclodipeptide synthase [Streptomyces sp. TX20-6-3]
MGVIRQGDYPCQATPSASPVAHRSTFDEHEACFLGVSLDNSSFRPARFDAMLKWVSRRYSRCTVLIGDSIHRLTLASTRGMDPDRALAHALFAKDDAFRASVEAFGRAYHAKHSATVDDAELRRRVDTSSAYFLEEFAVFCCLTHRDLPVMVYPGQFSTPPRSPPGTTPRLPTNSAT